MFLKGCKTFSHRAFKFLITGCDGVLSILFFSAVAAKCYVKLIETIDILAKDTDNIAAKLAVATMQAMQPVVMSLLDLIDGVKGDIEVEA